MNIFKYNQETIKSYSLTEEYPKDKVEYLLNNKDIIKKYCINDKNKFDEVYYKSMVYQLTECKKETREFKYYANQKEEGKSIYYNRWYAKGGYTKMPNQIRKFLQGNEIIDIDIKNACCSVLLGITKQYNIETKYLNRYVENRDEIIKKYYDGNKDACKTFIQFCVFSDKARTNNKFEENLNNEMNTIKINLSKEEDFRDIYRHNRKIKKENIFGSFLCNVYTIYETNIIYNAMGYYEKKTGNKVMTQQHDGFQTKPNDKFNLEKLNKYINNEMGFENLEFIIKPNDSEIIIKSKEEKEKEEVKEKEEKEEKLNTFEKMSKEFEKTHCKIQNSSLFIREYQDNNIIFNKSDLKTTYEHLTYEVEGKDEEIKKKIFIDKWLRGNDDMRRYDTMEIIPHPLECPSNTYNLWKPFEMEKITEYKPMITERDILLNHIKILCGNDVMVYDYFIKWIAQMIQYPATKSICPTLISKQGGGKTSIVILLQKMMGKSKIFETADPLRDVWGTFNGLMSKAFLVNLDEVSKKDTMEVIGKIKKLITSGTITINHKMKDPYEINSFHRFLMTTNSEEPIVVEDKDRRNFVIRSSDELIGNKKYFTDLYKLLDDINVIKTCYEYFKGIPDMDKFGDLETPQTEHQNNLKQLSRSPIEQWLEYFTLQNIKKKNVKIEMAATEACNLFKIWCDANKLKYDIDAIKFGVRLSNMNIKAIETGRKIEKGRTKYYDIDGLKTHFKLDCLILDEVEDDEEE